jgi:hypothetical protein
MAMAPLEGAKMKLKQKPTLVRNPQHDRREMLNDRAERQRARTEPTRWYHHGIAAWLNRHTGQPHEHVRQKARRLRQRSAT